jgi:predicted acetyltransferase
MIKGILIEQLNPYISDAKKSGLVFNKSTNFYGLYIDNRLCGFTGLVISSNKAIFKNHYVMPNERGNGYFKMMLSFSIDIVKSMGIKTIEATCTPMSVKEYLNRGFKVVKQYKVYTKVRYENL